METTDANNSEMLAQFDAQLAKLLRQRDDLTSECSKLQKEINDEEENYSAANSERSKFIEECEQNQRTFESSLGEFSSLKSVTNILKTASEEVKTLFRRQNDDFSEALSQTRQTLLYKIDLCDQKKLELRKIETQIESIKRKMSFMEAN